QLISEHDEVIKTAKACLELLNKGKLTDQEGEEAAKAARALLVHVSNCDGLAILSERLHEEELKALGNKLSVMRGTGVSLLEWAEKIRKK
ncbi:MAG: hemerythrin domain-containing protein, partial [Thermodesulfobacteriota bacterium]